MSILAGLLLAGCSGTQPAEAPSKTEPERIAAAGFVGREVCAACHPTEVDLWEGSHHDLAMQVASGETVLGNFEGATFTYNGITSTFFKREEKYLVRTDGPDGQLQEYEIAYTFGVEPLQQYLIAFPGGRYQVLSLCWDTRPARQGGQRWFHLYPGGQVTHEHPLHWTGISQNWNHMCAECHSTNWKKNYLQEEDRFQTTWSEIDVACEACHGPASRHVAWAEARPPGEELPQEQEPNGLITHLGEESDVAWVFEGDSATAKRVSPRQSQAQMETCARCHSRRGVLNDDYQHGRPLMDTHRLALLDESLYYADGQIQDEVYVYGSFLQSRMYHEGVTCSDCHDPHRLNIDDPPDDVCLKCHLPEKFQTSSHHFHPSDSSGASCVECHMPARPYMVVDPRRDHSFRIPRPDLSLKIGTPNACTACHIDRSSQWAADRITQWYGPERSSRPHFGEALYAGRNNRRDAGYALAQLAGDLSMPGIARATALSLLPGYYLGPGSLEGIQSALQDIDPLVRASAANLTEVLEPQVRLSLTFPLLSDPIRGVRLQAVQVLASVPPSLWSPQQLTVRDQVLAEYRQAQRVNADRPGAHLNLGVLHQQLGELEEAERAYQRALQLAPSSVAPYINLADLYRQLGRDPDGERLLRQALSVRPEDGDAHHALGLLLVRQDRDTEAVLILSRAAELRPDNWRYSYVLGIALDSVGRLEEALDTLKRAHERHPGNVELLLALTTMYRDSGEVEEARRYADQLLELAPENSMFRQLRAQLEVPER